MGRAKSYFVSKVKNFLLGDPNRGNQSSCKVLRCHFYQHGIFIIRSIPTFVWPFCFLVCYSLLIKKKMVSEMERQRRWLLFTNEGRPTCTPWCAGKRVKGKKKSYLTVCSKGSLKDKILYKKMSCWGSLCAKVGPCHACPEDDDEFGCSAQGFRRD